LTGRKNFCFNTFRSKPPSDGRSQPMEPRFQQRLERLLADCQVPSTAFRGAIQRLEIFAQPFVVSLLSPEERDESVPLRRCCRRISLLSAWMSAGPIQEDKQCKPRGRLADEQGLQSRVPAGPPRSGNERRTVAGTAGFQPTSP